MENVTAQQVILEAVVSIIVSIHEREGIFPYTIEYLHPFSTKICVYNVFAYFFRQCRGAGYKLVRNIIYFFYVNENNQLFFNILELVNFFLIWTGSNTVYVLDNQTVNEMDLSIQI